MEISTSTYSETRVTVTDHPLWKRISESRVEIVNSSADPGAWHVSLIDYDGNVGATGLFTSKDEAMGNLDGFLDLAVPAYDRKYAKYGDMPVISLENGKLVMRLDQSRDLDAEIEG
jgi:hypothetical protein